MERKKHPTGVNTEFIKKVFWSSTPYFANTKSETYYQSITKTNY